VRRTALDAPGPSWQDHAILAWKGTGPAHR